MVLDELTFGHSLQLVFSYHYPDDFECVLLVVVGCDKDLICEDRNRFLLSLYRSRNRRARSRPRSSVKARVLRLRPVLEAVIFLLLCAVLISIPEWVDLWLEFQFAYGGPVCPSCLESVRTVGRCYSAEAGADDIPAAQRHFVLDWMLLAYLFPQVFLETV